MKIRKGFVSNSSSSSFVCDVCGESIDPEYGEVSKCFGGHMMCYQDHCINLPIDTWKKEIIKCLEDRDEIELCDEDIDFINTETDIKELKDFLKNYDWDMITSSCPLCTLKTIPNYLSFSYLIKKLGMDEEKLKEEIRFNFKTEKELLEFIRS